MQWILTGRLLWRASSNLRTLRRGCCSRPPNGLQSGWGMKSHNEELWDPLCCRQCRWLYQNKMQLYFFLFLSDSHLYFTDVCNITFLCMRRVSSINPVKSNSFTFLLTDVPFHEIVMLSLPCFCVRKIEVYQKRKKLDKNKFNSLRKPVSPCHRAAAAKISFRMVSLFQRLFQLYSLTRRGTLELKLSPVQRNV